MLETIEYPNFSKIVGLCTEKIAANYKKYGNSWTVGNYKPYLIQRLYEELEEYKLTNNDFSQTEKLIDIINIASMALTNILKQNHKTEGLPNGS